jgi:hypothetical protein
MMTSPSMLASIHGRSAWRCVRSTTAGARLTAMPVIIVYQ